jgi:hypothetical protein
LTIYDLHIQLCVENETWVEQKGRNARVWFARGP